MATPTAADWNAPAAAGSGSAMRFLGLSANNFSSAIVLWQITLVVLFGTATEFDSSFGYGVNSTSTANNDANWGLITFISSFLLIGFGFAYTLANKYTVAPVGNTILITALVFQWAQLLNGFWDNSQITFHDPNQEGWVNIPLSYNSLLRAQYTVVTVLITFGALGGRASALQLAFIALLETIFATANSKIGSENKIIDIGGTMYVHIFGAAFGIAASLAIGTKKEAAPTVETNRSTANAGFGLLGTATLIALFPVFNAATVYWTLNFYTNGATSAQAVAGAATFRSYFNTLFAVTSAAAGAFIASKAQNHGRFAYAHIQNGAIAGGVVVAAFAPIVKSPWGAQLAGLVVGFLAVWSISYWQHGFAAWHLDDQANVITTHLIPGIIGSIASAIAAARVTSGEGWDDNNVNTFNFEARPQLEQGGYQMAFGLITLAFALITGLVTGFVARVIIFDPKGTTTLDDSEEFTGIEGTGATAPVIAAVKAAAPVPAEETRAPEVSA